MGIAGGVAQRIAHRDELVCGIKDSGGGAAVCAGGLNQATEVVKKVLIALRVDRGL
jgi:hypothetical protein